MEGLKLTLVTPNKRFFEDKEVEDVLVPGYVGELNILPGHSPLITTLNPGVMKYKEKGSNVYKSFVISWGYCEVGPNGVVVLAETAEAPEEIDLKRAESAREKAERALLSQEISLESIIKNQNKIRRSQVRIEVAKGSGSNTAH
ncbi:MAG: hypothetical protein A4S09_08870 [Proteobacteria bacterium SG_bin7]|nr:MAG: hypothetical protein A4S09_08870 [Proteobacteria bacterium SG_bin7]